VIGGDCGIFSLTLVWYIVASLDSYLGMLYVTKLVGLKGCGLREGRCTFEKGRFVLGVLGVCGCVWVCVG
jgi:hypothetical protein